MTESPKTPTKSRSENRFCSKSNKKDSKNPYSTRGLDKFSALVAELEEKRQKILSQEGSENISFVRFVYKDTDNYVPVVVKAQKDNKDEKTMCGDHDHNKDKTPNHAYSEIMAKFPLESSEVDQNEDRLQRSGSNKKRTKKMKFSWDIFTQPAYYLPVAVILILLLLAFFGRSFVIICTSILWYVIPTITGSSNVRSSMKKKDYVKRTSDKKMVCDHGILSSPKTSKSLNDYGNLKDQSPRKNGQRRSW